VQKSVLVITKHTYTECGRAGGFRSLLGKRKRETDGKERAPTNGLGKLTNGTKRNGSPSIDLLVMVLPLLVLTNEIQFPIGPRKAKAEKLLALSLREESLADGRCCCCCCCHRCNAYYYLISFDFPSSFSDSVYPKVVRFGKALLFTDFYRTKTTTHTTKCKCNT